MTYSKHVTLSGLFSLISYLILISIAFCIDFVSFLKGLNMREFQNNDNFIIFWKKIWIQKEMLCFQHWLKTKLTEKTRSNEKWHFLYIWRNWKCPQYISEVGLSAYGLRSLHNKRHFHKIKQSTQKPHGVNCFLSFGLVFCLPLIFFLLVCFFTLHFV